MKLKELYHKLELKPVNDISPDREVKDAYVSDLLSDVIANAKPDSVWITLQTHPNIIAVATLKNISAIIITNNRTVDNETLEKARKEGIPLFVTSHTTFEIAGRLYGLLKGSESNPL